MQRLQADFVLGARYALRERIAAGGMGDVWLVEDRHVGRTLALKIMHPYTADELTLARRFREEALIGARLRHPNIVAVHDFGEEAGLAYLVMEYVPGRTLAHLLHRDGALAPARVTALLVQIAAGLGAAHEAGIIHRDVKPANILVTPDGTAKVTDFGIARAVKGLGLTMTGEVMGTPQYISPEQALGRSATAASDVYALGVVAHEMLTGARPFDAETPVATALAHAYQDPPPLPSHTPTLLAEVVRACLAKDPRQRPATGHEVVQRLLGQPRGESAVTTDLADQPASAPAPAPVAPPPLVPSATLLATPSDDTGDVRRRPTTGSYAVAALVFSFYLALIYLTRT